MTSRLPFGNQSLKMSMNQPWSQPDTIRMEPGPLGWRSGKWENTDSEKILMGNWVQNSFDTVRQRVPPPLANQISNYFRTTYASDFDKEGPLIPAELRTWKDRYPRAFPGHQPELDPHYFRTYGRKLLTSTEDAYQNPKEVSNWSTNLLNFGPAGWRPRQSQPMSNVAHCFRTSYGLDFNKNGCPTTEAHHKCPVRMTPKHPTQQPHVSPFFYQNYNRCFPPDEFSGRGYPLFNDGKGGWRIRTSDPLSHIRCGRL